MDIVGVIASCIGILDGIIAVIDETKNAYGAQKNGTELLQNVHNDVTAIASILQSIRNEVELHKKDHIEVAVGQLNDKATKLDETIKQIAAKFNRGEGLLEILRNFTDAQSDRDCIKRASDDLNAAKSTLILSLQSAQVGIIQSLGQVVLFNADTVARVEKLLLECSEIKEGLRVTRLIAARGKRTKPGEWELTVDDLALLERPPPYEEPQTLTERITIGNRVGKRGTFLSDVGKDNAGDDAIRDIHRLEVRDNVFEEQSVAFTAPTSFNNVARLLRIHQEGFKIG